MVGEGKRKFKLSSRKGKKKTPAPPWIELPRDVTANILQRLGAIEIIESAQKVCTTWRRVCQDPAMWRVIHMINPDDLGMACTLDVMCRHAVDRSQGQLIDINIEGFGTDELVDHIADRSSDLRRLALANSYNISGDCLSEAVKRFPKLEELSLILMSNTLYFDEIETTGISCPIEAIGKSCPLLKSFTLINHACRHPISGEIIADEFGLDIDDNEYAKAVAKSMPNLRRLVLVANDMTNEGLQAVLDGCPLLESLDIRQCFGLDLKGALGERCSKQIKQLRRPSEPTKDIRYIIGNDPRVYHLSPDYYSDEYYGYF